MASSDSPAASISSPITLSPSKKENRAPAQAKIAELNESRTELFSRIHSLKRDLQNWRSNLDTQVKSYREELTELRKSLNVEVEQLRSEFQELRTTLQQQQEDVTASLRSLGLQDLSSEAGVAAANEVDSKDNNVEVDHSENSTHEIIAQESAVECDDKEIHISRENGDKDGNEQDLRGMYDCMFLRRDVISMPDRSYIWLLLNFHA